MGLRPAIVGFELGGGLVSDCLDKAKGVSDGLNEGSRIVKGLAREKEGGTEKREVLDRDIEMGFLRSNQHSEQAGAVVINNS